MEEEKKESVTPETPAVPEVDEDFADTPKPQPIVEEPKPEEKPSEEPKPEPLEEQPEDKIEEKEAYEYPDERLAKIEAARKEWNKKFRKGNRIKTILSFVVLAAIIAGYAIPYFVVQDTTIRSQVCLGVAGGLAVVGLLTIGLLGYFQKKKNQEQIGGYFKAYYDNMTEYLFDGTPVTDVTGGYEKKITKEEVEASGLYPGVSQIGSRDEISFSYEGTECSLCDMAAQKDTGKALATIFVGKYLRAHNTCEVSQTGLVIYFRGNDRAIPPLCLEGMSKISETKTYAIYGSSADKRVLKRGVEALFKKVHTSKLLVDVAISIKPGKTYMALGYEDTLMILPNDKPYNPAYTEAYKPQLELFLQIAAALNASEPKE